VTQYLNGDPNGSATNSNARGDSGTVIRIGSRNDGGIWFTGRLCDAAVYNCALAADELALNYKIGSGQPTHTQRYFFAASMDAIAAAKFRRTLSPLGTRIGSRQVTR
jgi:hypothetical protein